MEILFVASEIAPAVKVGGLADAVFALSKALKNLGARVAVALPKVPAFEAAGVLAARRLTPLPLGSSEADLPTEAILYDARLASGVDLVLFDGVVGGKSLFGEPGDLSEVLYGRTGAISPMLKFAWFSKAVTQFVKGRNEPFDVVHAHDWPAALVPYLIRNDPTLDKTKTVLTIHNLAHQGLERGAAAEKILRVLGLGSDHFTPETLEFYGGINLLKGGIVGADVLSTVSQTYAREILTEAGGQRLEGVLRARVARGREILGIQNGVDPSIWNPATDPALPARYDADDPSNKVRCKASLLAELGLSVDPNLPLFVSLGRITHQKGSDLLAAAMPRVLRQELQLVVAGAGDAGMEHALAEAAAFAPDRAKILGSIQETMAHRLLGAADFVVMPSRFEPCGLVQLQAQRYGALPIATATGGLVDSIVDLDAELESGTGMLLDGASVESIVGGFGRALAAFTHPRFAAVRRRVMRLDLGWDRPARRYQSAYRQLLESK